MIISASRRTDIPALYAEWFINRVRAGFCDVANPRRPGRISRVSLRPGDVDAIVFWTRNAKPLTGHLDELDRNGFRYYFQYTVLGYPEILEPGAPSLEQAVDTLRELADRLGPGGVVWRYDPILLTGLTPEAYHLDRIGAIAEALKGRVSRLVVSLYDRYSFAETRLRALEDKGLTAVPGGERAKPAFLRTLAGIAAGAGLEIQSCAEDASWGEAGILPGKCVDDRLIEALFGREVTHRKDPHQRPRCGCVVSKDIGAYDTCPLGCVYCYATRDIGAARAFRLRHDPGAASLAARPAAEIR
jgi:hypothetical protein